MMTWGWKGVVLAACAAAGCAVAGAPATGDAPSGARDAVAEPRDAQHFTGDAPAHPPDAHLLDAFVPQDAPGSGSGGQFCSDNTNCPDTGTCCWVAICVPGQPVGATLCFPN